jgi:hypothetical protein
MKFWGVWMAIEDASRFLTAFRTFYSSERIPTLQDILCAAGTKRKFYILFLQNHYGLPPNRSGDPQAIEEALQKYRHDASVVNWVFPQLVPPDTHFGWLL